MGIKNTEVKNIKWQDPSKFNIQLVGPGADVLEIDPQILTMSCNGIALADLNVGPVEEWIGETWKFALGRLENYQITITFKDYENFTLYKKFSNALQKFTRMYPDEQKFDINISATDSFAINDFTPVVVFKNVVLVSVSGASLSNDAVASFAEFTVTCKCTHIEIPEG